jgi:hypothetical protein
MSDPWFEAIAGLQADVDAELRDDAYEVFVAEAARGRVVDRVGTARVVLRSGASVDGTLVTDAESRIEDHLVLHANGREVLVPLTAVVTIIGSQPGLRPDRVPDQDRAVVPRITRRLRESWQSGERVRVLTRTGDWISGVIVHVGADHADVDDDGTTITVLLRSVDAWELG